MAVILVLFCFGACNDKAEQVSRGLTGSVQISPSTGITAGVTTLTGSVSGSNAEAQAARFEYKWQLNLESIPSGWVTAGTEITYETEPEDMNHYVRLAVSHPDYEGTIISSYCYIRDPDGSQAGNLEGQVAIVSDPAGFNAGALLTANVTHDTLTTGFSYTWQWSMDGETNWANLNPASSANTYRTVQGDAGRWIRVSVSHLPEYDGSIESAPCKINSSGSVNPNPTPLNNTDYIPKGYFHEWTPGIPGGIPRADEVFENIDASDISKFSSTGDSTDYINSVIQRAGDKARDTGVPQVVKLSAGTFKTGNTDPGGGTGITILLNRSKVVLRGDGASTVIRGSIRPTGAIAIGAFPNNGSTNDYAGTKIVNLTADAFVGHNKITVESGHEYKAGDILMLDRKPDDKGDPSGLLGGTEWRSNQVGGYEWRKNNPYHFRQPPPDTAGGPNTDDGSWRSVRQYIEISRVEGNDLYITNKINIDFPLILNPQVWDTKAAQYKYIGLEDLKLESIFGSWANNASIQTTFASSYCWIKNVESDGTKIRDSTSFGGVHIRMKGFRNHVTGCYVHETGPENNVPGGNSYGIDIQGTDGLIDNNIAELLCKPMLGSASGGGNVIAYNYVPNTHSLNWSGPYQETAIDVSHGSYCHSDLYEGNFAANISTDTTWGNSGQIVYYRNHAWGRNLKKDVTWGNIGAVTINGWNNEHALIGNVWLSPAAHDDFPNIKTWDNALTPNPSDMVVYRIGGQGWDRSNINNNVNYDTIPGLTQGWTMSKFYRYHDYVYATPQGSLSVNFNPVKEIDVNDLPPSLYLTNAPDYFAGHTWPPVNPGGATHKDRVHKLPAQSRHPLYSSYEH